MFSWFVTKLNRFWSRLEQAVSESRRVSGVWVGVLNSDDEYDDQRLLDKVEAALKYIAQHDPLRFERLCKDIRRIWIRRDPYARGYFLADWVMCVLDKAHVARESTSTARIAVTIVHEGTHARLHRRGVRYEQGNRARIERTCNKAALAFARKTPESADLVPDLERSLTGERLSSEAYWTDERMRARWRDSRAVALVELGTPGWLLRLLGVKDGDSAA